MSVMIESSPKPFDTDVKRFYVPGTVITAVCPKCGVQQHEDLSGCYLSYPKANEPTDHEFYCEVYDNDHNNIGCGRTWSVPIVLEIRVRLA